MVTLQGEPQADHIRTKPNGDKKRQVLQYQRIVGLFLLFQSCLKDKKGHEKTRLSIQIVPPSPKND